MSELFMKLVEMGRTVIKSYSNEVFSAGNAAEDAVYEALAATPYKVARAKTGSRLDLMGVDLAVYSKPDDTVWLIQVKAGEGLNRTEPDPSLGGLRVLLHVLNPSNVDNILAPLIEALDHPEQLVEDWV